MDGIQFELTEPSAGAAEFLRTGEALSAGAFDTIRKADAALLGPMGLPNVRWPDGRELTPQLDLRERLELYCGMRPIRLYHADDSPLKKVHPSQIDFVIVRENTEGLFSTRQAKGHGSTTEVCDALRITRHGAERVIRSAFHLARQHRHKVTLVDKANVLPSMVFFRSVFNEVARAFPDVETERIYVDAAALCLLRCPLTVTNVGTPNNKSGDTFNLFSGALSGSIALNPLPPLWPGLSWNTTSVNNAGMINVIGTAIPPQISSVGVSGANLVLSGSGGLAGATYYVISTSNVAAPLATWPRIATNTFALDGSFTNSLPLSLATPQRYFGLEVP